MSVMSVIFYHSTTFTLQLYIGIIYTGSFSFKLVISTLTSTGNFTQLYIILHLLDSIYLLVFKEVLSSVLFVIYCDVLFVIYCDAL